MEFQSQRTQESQSLVMQAVYTVVYHSLLSISLTWPHMSVVLPSLLSWDLLLVLSPPPPPSTSLSQVCEFQSSLREKLSSTHSEPVDPVAPEYIVFREVESESVVIQWTVAYISYSPETYVVQYGTSRETLVHNSSRRASEVDTTTYSVSLSGLRDNTTYYVQVLATNTALRSSRSSVESFTILRSAGVRYEYLLFVCLCTALLFVNGAHMCIVC